MTDLIKDLFNRAKDTRTVEELLKNPKNPIEDVSISVEKLTGGGLAETTPKNEIIINDDIEDDEIDDFTASRLVHELTHALTNKNYLERPEEVKAFYTQVKFLLEKEHSPEAIKEYLLPIFTMFKDKKDSTELLDKMIEHASNQVKNASSMLFRLTKTSALASLKFTPEEKAIMNRIQKAAEQLGITVYLAGGILRDKLLGKQNEDMDFVTDKDSQKLAALVAKAYKLSEPVHMDKSGATMLHMDDKFIDIIDAEKVYRPVGAESLEQGQEAEMSIFMDDAYRRDLTINSLMYNLHTGKLIDPTGKGIEDLEHKVIRTIIDPHLKYRIHAPDMLRALRFYAVGDAFKFAPEMLEAMKENAPRVLPRDKGGDVSARRIERELRKAFKTPQSWDKMKGAMHEVGLGQYIADQIKAVDQDRQGGIEYGFDKEKQASIQGLTHLGQSTDPVGNPRQDKYTHTWGADPQKDAYIKEFAARRSANSGHNFDPQKYANEDSEQEWFDKIVAQRKGGGWRFDPEAGWIDGKGRYYDTTKHEWVKHPKYPPKQQATKLEPIKPAPAPQQQPAAQSPAQTQQKETLQQKVNKTWADVKNKAQQAADQAKSAGQQAANYTMIPAVINQLLDQLPAQQKAALANDPKYQTLMALMGKPVQNGNEVLQGIGQLLRGITNFSASYLPTSQEQGAYEGLMGNKSGVDVPLYQSKDMGEFRANYNPANESGQVYWQKSFSVKPFTKRTAQTPDQAFIEGPQVQIDPSIQREVQDAVNELKKMDPNLFKGVGKIVALTSGPFGEVTSKDPTTVQINLNRIKQEVQRQLGGQYSPSNPEHKKVFDEAVKRSIAETVAHEAAHVKDFDPESNRFPGGEGTAESAEQQARQRLHHDKPIQLGARSRIKPFSKKAVEEVSSVALIDGDDLLMGLRSDDDTYALPGGHLEDGETPAEAVMRELTEESGLEVNEDDLTFLGTKTTENDEGIEVTVHAFGAPLTDDPVSTDEMKGWEIVNTVDGLPEKIEENLHNKDDDVTLQLLGLQKASGNFSGHPDTEALDISALPPYPTSGLLPRENVLLQKEEEHESEQKEHAQKLKQWRKLIDKTRSSNRD